jgi:hypothetical protein
MSCSWRLMVWVLITMRLVLGSSFGFDDQMLSLFEGLGDRQRHLELFVAVFVVADASGDTTAWTQNRFEIQIAHGCLGWWSKRGAVRDTRALKGYRKTQTLSLIWQQNPNQRNC